MILPNQSIGTLRNAAVVLGRHAGIMPALARLASLSAADDTKKCDTYCCGVCTCCGGGDLYCCLLCGLSCPNRASSFGFSTGTILL